MIEKNLYISKERNLVKVFFCGIEDIKYAIEVMDRENISKCEVVLDANERLELEFSENLDYLELLYKEHYNIDFYYDDRDNLHFPLKKIIEDEKMLNLIVKEIKEANFSPLEQFICAFDIVNFFKPYLKEPQDMNYTNSRALYEYLNNNYMVCAGYADLLTNLCNRVGIFCLFYLLKYKSENEEKGYEYHARNLVYINDPKYNISSYFVSDATAPEKLPKENGILVTDIDNILKTNKEQAQEDDYIYDDLEVFNMTKEEFLKRCKTNGYGFKKQLKKQFVNFDPVLFILIYKTNFVNASEDELLKIYNYIQEKINKPIDKLTLLEAIMVEKSYIFKDMPNEFLKELEDYYAKRLKVDFTEYSYHTKLTALKRGRVKTNR